MAYEIGGGGKPPPTTKPPWDNPYDRPKLGPKPKPKPGPRKKPKRKRKIVKSRKKKRPTSTKGKGGAIASPAPKAAKKTYPSRIYKPESPRAKNIDPMAPGPGYPTVTEPAIPSYGGMPPGAAPYMPMIYAGGGAGGGTGGVGGGGFIGGTSAAVPKPEQEIGDLMPPYRGNYSDTDFVYRPDPWNPIKRYPSPSPPPYTTDPWNPIKRYPSPSPPPYTTDPWNPIKRYPSPSPPHGNFTQNRIIQQAGPMPFEYEPWPDPQQRYDYQRGLEQSIPVNPDPFAAPRIPPPTIPDGYQFPPNLPAHGGTKRLASSVPKGAPDASNIHPLALGPGYPTVTEPRYPAANTVFPQYQTGASGGGTGGFGGTSDSMTGGLAGASSAMAGGLADASSALTGYSPDNNAVPYSPEFDWRNAWRIPGAIMGGVADRTWGPTVRGWVDEGRRRAVNIDERYNVPSVGELIGGGIPPTRVREPSPDAWEYNRNMMLGQTESPVDYATRPALGPSTGYVGRPRANDAPPLYNVKAPAPTAAPPSTSGFGGSTTGASYPTRPVLKPPTFGAEAGAMPKPPAPPTVGSFNPSMSKMSTPGGNLSNTAGQATKGRSATRGGYSGSSAGGSRGGYSGGGYSGGGGSSGGGSSSGAWGSYGMSDDWMNAYQAFWGQNMPDDMYAMYQPIMDLFARYGNRMPQIYDWQKMWSAMRAGDETGEMTNMWGDISPYEAMIQSEFVRPPLFTPPGVSYSPGMSF